jgi:hypothetical protein
MLAGCKVPSTSGKRLSNLAPLLHTTHLLRPKQHTLSSAMLAALNAKQSHSHNNATPDRATAFSSRRIPKAWHKERTLNQTTA